MSAKKMMIFTPSYVSLDIYNLSSMLKDLPGQALLDASRLEWRGPAVSGDDQGLL